MHGRHTTKDDFHNALSWAVHTQLLHCRCVCRGVDILQDACPFRYTMRAPRLSIRVCVRPSQIQKSTLLETLRGHTFFTDRVDVAALREIPGLTQRPARVSNEILHATRSRRRRVLEHAELSESRRVLLLEKFVCGLEVLPCVLVAPALRGRILHINH